MLEKVPGRAVGSDDAQQSARWVGEEMGSKGGADMGAAVEAGQGPGAGSQEAAAGGEEDPAGGPAITLGAFPTVALTVTLTVAQPVLGGGEIKHGTHVPTWNLTDHITRPRTRALGR